MRRLPFIFLALFQGGLWASQSALSILKPNAPLVNATTNTTIKWQINSTFSYEVWLQGLCRKKIASQGLFARGKTQKGKVIHSEILAQQLAEGGNRISICLYDESDTLQYRYLSTINKDQTPPLSRLSINANGELQIACQDFYGCQKVEFIYGKEGQKTNTLTVDGDPKELITLEPQRTRGYYTIRYRAFDIANNPNPWQETNYRFFTLSRFGLEPMALFAVNQVASKSSYGLLTSYERGLDDIDFYRGLSEGSSLWFPAVRFELAYLFGTAKPNLHNVFGTAGLLWRLPLSQKQSSHMTIALGLGPALLSSDNQNQTALTTYAAFGYEYPLGDYLLFARTSLRHFSGVSLTGLGLSAGVVFSW